MTEIVDLRDGYRIEVSPMLFPANRFAVRLHRPQMSDSGRKTWKQVGPMVVADDPEDAAKDMLTAMNQGLLPGVEVRA